VTSPSTPPELLAEGPASVSWTSAIAALRIYRETRGTADIAPRVRAVGINLSTWVTRCRDDYWHGVLNAHHVGDLESIEGWTWGPDRPSSWRHAFDVLARHAAEHGTIVLTEYTTLSGIDLHAWSTTQRHRYTRGALAPASVELLEGLPEWQWDAGIARWTQGLAAARLYVQRNGSLAHVDRDTRLGDFSLGHWVQRCREDRRADTMPMQRATELEALPGWSWRQPSRENWSDGWEALQRFITQTGHAAPTQHEVSDGFPLGWWVTRRRRDYRASTLSPERTAELEALPGWQWDPNDVRWQRGLAALSGYADLTGHANPARGERFKGYPVGDWVRAQRIAHRNDRLSPIRAAHLESLPGWQYRT
jgi:hypothetical protein